MDDQASRGELAITPATRADAGLVLELIRELAAYEKLEHEVSARVEDLERTLFGERRYAEVVLARLDAHPVGFALFFHNYSTFLGRQGIYLEGHNTPRRRAQRSFREILSIELRIGIQQ